MDLQTYRGYYEARSATASNVARQSAFAGIALVWIFKDQVGQEFALPMGLLYPTICMMVGLAADLMQYVVASAIWGFYCRIKEKEFDPDPNPEFRNPNWINWPALGLFWLKLAAVLVGYVLLVKYAIGAIHFN
ncbi:hypothetical protein [Parahaliea mediterranea]|uniref:Uncharacterized protein n=1 Tax=Parahaliea mediterranea TaxID=651086 RepID=A0A939III5_9GAMM|nr:hypothetical protein [Parahaliea mediterranea]MBN7796649.1 hypothetical protein [Parahaliea mediterranea]